MKGRRFDKAYLRPFGAPAFVHKNLRGNKLLPKAIPGIYVGFSHNDLTHIVYAPSKPSGHREMRSIHVRFGQLGRAKQILTPLNGDNGNDSTDDEADVQPSHPSDDDGEAEEQPSQLTAPPITPPQSPIDPLLMDMTDFDSEGEASVAAVKSRQSLSNDNPATVAQALKSKFSNEWQEAMDAELSAMEALDVFDRVAKVPHGSRIINSRFVFTIKRDACGGILKFKARLVAQGFTQQKDLDYDEVFSATVSIDSMRAILASMVARGWEMRQGDISNAYLNADIDKELYLSLPDKSTARLRKAIYGLKQSGRLWNRELNKFLTEELKLTRCNTDQCVYRADDLIILVYVDDIIVCAPSIESIQGVEKQLQSRFPMKDLSELGLMLGISMSYNRKNGDLTLSQSHYLRETLEDFGMTDCRPLATPLDPGYKDSPASEGEFTDPKPYRRLIGKLRYAADRTRPDLVTALSILSRHMQTPAERHWKVLLRILRYVKGTLDYKLTYTQDENHLNAFTDAGWHSDKTTSRSRTGFVVRYGDSPVAWKSKLQRVIATSVAEAEYMALADCCHEIIFMRQLFAELFHKEQPPTLIRVDNQAAIKVAEGCASSMGHVRVRFHFARQCVEENIAQLQYCPTNEMIADMFTKPLAKPKVSQFCQQLNLC